MSSINEMLTNKYTNYNTDSSLDKILPTTFAKYPPPSLNNSPCNKIRNTNICSSETTSQNNSPYVF